MWSAETARGSKLLASGLFHTKRPTLAIFKTNHSQPVAISPKPITLSRLLTVVRHVGHGVIFLIFRITALLSVFRCIATSTLAEWACRHCEEVKLTLQQYVTAHYSTAPAIVALCLFTVCYPLLPPAAIVIVFWVSVSAEVAIARLVKYGMMRVAPTSLQ